MKSQFELIHSPEYPALLKATQRFVSKGEHSMALTMVQHREGGSMVASDRHKAVIIQKAHGFKEEMLINPFTFEAAVGNFPDVEKAVANQGKQVFTLEHSQISVWLQVHKSMNQMNKTFGIRTNLGEMVFGKEAVKLRVGESDETKVSVELPYHEYKNPSITKVAYNVSYMRDALQIHQDFGTKELLISIGTPLMPIHLDDQASRLKAIILPFRR